MYAIRDSKCDYFNTYPSEECYVYNYRISKGPLFIILKSVIQILTSLVYYMEGSMKDLYQRNWKGTNNQNNNWTNVECNWLQTEQGSPMLCNCKGEGCHQQKYRFLFNCLNYGKQLFLLIWCCPDHALNIVSSSGLQTLRRIETNRIR